MTKPGTIIAMISGAVVVVAATALVTIAVLRSGADESYGAIIVGEPTIFSRERLVNDRFEQEHWLHHRLEITDDIEKRGSFERVQLFGSTSASTKILAGVNVGAAQEKEGGQKDAAEAKNANAASKDDNRIAINLGKTPLDLFQDLIVYRDEVRQVLMQTQLDDRHDIAGNTLIRLDFDASIVPTGRTSDTALVTVSVSEASRSPTEDKVLYEQWRSHLQLLYDEAVENLIKTIHSRSELAKGDRRNLHEFVRFISARIEAELMRYPESLGKIEASPEIMESCEELFDAGARNFIAVGLYECRAYILSRFLLSELGRRKELVRFYRFIGELNKNDKIRSELKAQHLNPGSLFAQLPEQCKLRSSNDQTANPDTIQTIEVNKLQLPCPEGPDPFRDALDSQIILLQYLQISPSRGHEEISKRLDALVGKMQVAFATHPEGFTGNQADDKNIHDELLGQAAAVDVAVRRAVALFMRSKGEFDPDSDTKLSNYYDLRIEDCALGLCRVLIAAKAAGEERTKAINKLVTALDNPSSGARVFAYAVSPKQLVEYSIQRSQADRLTDLFAGGQASPASLPADVSAKLDWQRSTDQTSEALQHLPLVVGFGVGGSVDRDKAAFGWAIRPPIVLAGTSNRAHVAVQHTLSATVSLPSWWKRVKIDTVHCWLPGRSIGDVTAAVADDRSKLESYCRPETRASNEYEIALPWNVFEISRKLGIEVIPEPYVSPTSTFETQRLEIGRPGQIVFEGGRLWRSTVVTLGNYQQANEITVMPNMQGIVAKFDCVLSPPSLLGQQAPPQEQYQLAVVWTSEGRTEAVRIKLDPFRPRKGIDKYGNEVMEKESVCSGPPSSQAGKSSG